MIGGKFNLKQLEALIWVADLGSFRKAAEHLNTTQPNISARISGLENTLGMVLMQRDSASVRLTARGAEIVERARCVLREAEGLIEVASRADLIEGRLRLGVTELVACTWLRLFLREMKRAYPSLSVELTIDLSVNLDQKLASGVLDITFQTAPFTTQVAGLIELSEYRYIWVASPVVARMLPRCPGFDDLLSQPVLTPARYTQAYQELSAHCAGKGALKPRIVPSGSLTSSLHMAVDGIGISVQPRVMVLDELTGGALVELPVDWVPTPLRFFARYHADKCAGVVVKSGDIAKQCAESFDATKLGAIAGAEDQK